MSDTYFDLPSRLEDSFPEIDSDIVTDLRKTSEEYAESEPHMAKVTCFSAVLNGKTKYRRIRQ